MSNFNKGIPKRVCFISLYSYPLFNPLCISPFGGSEVRVSLIAKELAKRDRFRISMIVFDHGQPDQEVRDGVSLLSWKGRACPLQVNPKRRNRTENQEDGNEAPFVERETNGPDCEGMLGQFLPSSFPGLNEFLRVVFHPAKASRRNLIRQVRNHPFFRHLSPATFELVKCFYFLVGQMYRRAARIPGLCLHWASHALQEVNRAKRYLCRRVGAFGHIRKHMVYRECISIYDKVDADVYILHGNSELAAELAFYCRRRGKKYVFLAGSDGDYHPGYKMDSEALGLYGLPGYLMVYAIENATLHIAQNEHQRELLGKYYRRSCVVIKNPIDLTMTHPCKKEGKEILWVGKSDWIKRPEIMIDAARYFPEYSFTLIMTLSNLEIHERCLQAIQSLPNVSVLNYIPYPEVEIFFARAKLFVNTSLFEGFPNTFLQALKHSIPIVSYQVDPGQVISRHGCGLLCEGDFEKLKQNLHLLMTNAQFYEETSSRCTEYVAANHDKSKIISEYESVLNSIMDGA
jgi:glycosyltransferase involved in cell wall biosynthesis